MDLKVTGSEGMGLQDTAAVTMSDIGCKPAPIANRASVRRIVLRGGRHLTGSQGQQAHHLVTQSRRKTASDRKSGVAHSGTLASLFRSSASWEFFKSRPTIS